MYCCVAYSSCIHFISFGCFNTSCMLGFSEKHTFVHLKLEQSNTCKNVLRFPSLWETCAYIWKGPHAGHSQLGTHVAHHRGSIGKNNPCRFMIVSSRLNFIILHWDQIQREWNLGDIRGSQCFHLPLTWVVWIIGMHYMIHNVKWHPLFFFKMWASCMACPKATIQRFHVTTPIEERLQKHIPCRFVASSSQFKLHELICGLWPQLKG